MQTRPVPEKRRAPSIYRLLACALTLFFAVGWIIPKSSQWTQTAGPPGGAIGCVAVDVEDSQIVYAAVEQAGIYRSTDGGRSWSLSHEGIGQWISDICSTPYGVFASYSHFGLLHSSDQGKTWDWITVADEHRITGVHYGVHGDTLLARTERGQLYVSRDGGQTWQDATGDLPRDEILAMGVRGPEEYWVASGRGLINGLYVTINGGQTWIRSSLVSIPDACVRHMLVADDESDLILVGFHNIHNEGRPEGVSYSWISRDGGETWSPHWGGFDPDNGWWPLAQGPDGALYVNNANHIYRSSDRGATWQNLHLVEALGGRRPGDISRMDVDPDHPDRLYIAVLNGIAVSRDGGAFWTLESDGILRTRISLVAADPLDPNTVYAASANGGGTYRTTNGGDSWMWLNGGGLPHPWVDELMVHPVDPSIVYEIVDTSEVYRSEDYGATWTTVWDDFNFSSVYTLAPAPSDPDVIYACKNGFGLFKSGDGGQWWQFLHHSEVDYTYTLAVHPQNADVVFSGYNPKPFQDYSMIRKSIDGGTHWATVLRLEGSNGITSIVFDPLDPDTLYAASIGEHGGRVHVSRDAGETWTVLNERFTMCTVWGQPQLIGDPTDPETVYAATWLGGTWKTTDAGATWSRLAGAPISGTSVAIDPVHPHVLFVSDRSSPTVWRSLDAGVTWCRVADFTQDRALLVMRTAVYNGIAYAATFHHGLRGGDLYRSRDNGETWDRITGSLPKGILDIAIDPRNTDTVYITTNINGAYLSHDGGNTWAPIENFPDVGAYDLEVHPTDSSIL